MDGIAQSKFGSNPLLLFDWHMRLKPKKTKSMVVSRSRTNAPGDGDLTLGDAELEGLKGLHILGVALDSSADV